MKKENLEISQLTLEIEGDKEPLKEKEVFEKDGAWYKKRADGSIVRVRKTSNFNPCGCI